MPANNITPRLVKCFQVIFPELPVSEIPDVSQASLAAWDSVATVTLANVVGEEFSVPMDLDKLAQLDSFESVRQWVLSETQTK